MSNIITVGNQPDSKISAFGDDSKFNNTNAFAYVIFENENLETARHSLLNLKEKYRIPDNVLLHMRLLNNDIYRSKNKVQHLAGNVLTELLSDIIDEMNKIPFLVKASYFSGTLPNDSGDEQGLDVVWSDKGVQSMLAKDALIRLNLKNYQYEDLRIIIAQDTTKIGFLGKNRRQAARWARGFSDIGAPSGYVYEFVLIIEEPSEEILLQLADIIVYMIAHAFDNEKASKDYRVILAKIRNYDFNPIVLSPD